ncbi:hypothetical protein [Arsukibacterium sp.]|uniref:hypothetical protein n=1 Tax=Arsukibacterium sp. TaxID=1977258 RepID=UPI001BD1FD8A|nr:hypothetical protein [Arsukibacterium sp.]
MDVKQLIVEPQVRTPWQVFDLAVRCYRLMWLPLFLLWLLLALPLTLLVTLLADPMLAAAVVWLCKPLLERPLLHYVSRAVFSEKPAIRSCLGALRVGGWWQLLLSITWYRLAWRRAFLAPVLLLEQQQGDARSNRTKTLKRLYNDRQGYWLVFCLHLEFLLALVMLLLVYSFLPAGAVPDWISSIQIMESNTGGYIMLVLTLLSYSLVAPLFVLGGFLTYINRRIALEAWDLELKFRKIALRLKAATTTVALLLCFTLGVMPQPLSANANQGASSVATAGQDASDTGATALYQPEYKEQIRQQVEQIYQEQELINYTSSWVQDDTEHTEVADADWLAFLAFIGDGLGVLGWLCIIAVSLGLLYWLYLNYERLLRPFIAKAPPVEPTIPLMFADLPAEINHDDLLAQARYYHQQANARLMLACLLRFALHHIQQHYPVRLSATMTEHECLNAISHSTPAQIGVTTRRLIDSWIVIAWGHQQLSLDSLGAILAELESWQQQAATV